MNPAQLLAHFDCISEAPDAIQRLRRFILDLAVRGRLVEQDPRDEPASELLKRIQVEKERLVKAGELRKLDPMIQFNESDYGFALPLGWTGTTLRSLCTSVTDGDHLPPPKAETGVPFLVIGNVRRQSVDFLSCRFVSNEYYNALDTIRRPRKGDLLYTLVGSYGIPVPVKDDRPFCVQRHIGIVRPSKLTNVGFLSRVMESNWVFDQATACATGIAQKTVPLAGLRKMLIPLPPLAEQQRIVAKVDELMALCDRLKVAQAEQENQRNRLVVASLHRLSNGADAAAFHNHARFYFNRLPRLTTRGEHIQQLRQTILNLAVRGKLVPQDPNDEPAEVWLSTVVKLLPSTDREIVEPPFSLPASWVWLRIVDVFEVAGGIQKTPYRAPRNNAFPYLGVGNVYRGHLDLTHVKKFELEPGELERRRLEPGDLLIIEGNGSLNEIGRCAEWNGEISNCVHQNHVIRCRPCDVRITPFVLLFLNSLNGIEIMQRLAITSSGLYSLSVGKIRQIEIPLPPLAEQQRIVAKVEELIALCDRLEAQLTTAQTESRRLLEALLHEALLQAS